MVFSKAFALAAIFATLTAAAPVNQKRAVVYETVTEIDVTTIDTTITLYPGQPTPSPVVFTTEVPVATTTPAPQAPVSTPPAVAAASPAPAPPVEPKPSPIEAPAAPATPVVPTTTAAPPPPPPPPAPTTTTQAPPPPPPAPTPSTTTTAAPAPTPAAPSGGSTGGSGGPSGSGAGTYYDTATSMSAPSFCDTANDGMSENVVALSVDIMSQALCGKSITITHNGKTSTGIVVDKCMGCAAGDVDMSRHMFGELDDLSAGRIPITWSL